MRWISCISFLFLVTMMPWNNLSAQTDPDTLEMAKEFHDSGKLKEALKLLEPYNAAHPADLNTGWIYAQAAWWAKQYTLAKKIYELTIWYHPENLYIQVDYANMLVSMGKYQQALPYLKNFMANYPDNYEVHQTLTKIQYYKGNYKKAMTEALILEDKDPVNQETATLLEDIRLAKAPWISITGNYFSDNQPLQTISPILQSSVWLHPLSTLRFSLRTPLFSQGGTYTNALWLQAGNSSFIWYGNWTVTLDAGVLKYPYKNTTTWTGNFELQKRSYRHLLTIFQAERRPYFNTGSSIDTVVNEYHVAETIRWDNYKSWSGEISYNWDYFLTDYNAIYAIAGWGLTPPLKASVFDFRLGYGVSYSTATDDNFQPVDSKADIIANYDPAVGINGIYYPYFTPNHQFVNSALLAIGIHPVKGFDIGISGNLGFFAKAKIPYLYLDTNGNGNGNGQIVIKKDFSNERYFPYTISAFISWQVSEKVSLRADYRYNSTYFYNENYAGVQLKIHLWNAKIRK